jgi:transposase-like protein
VVTVSPDLVRVESELSAGTLSCPSCDGGTLAPWAWARERPVGRGAGRQRVRPRRSRCRSCGTTHVLLPATMLVRRGDWAATTGRALELKAAGLGQRPIATAVGASRSTVRGWLSRFAVVGAKTLTRRAESEVTHYRGKTRYRSPRSGSGCNATAR